MLKYGTQNHLRSTSSKFGQKCKFLEQYWELVWSSPFTDELNLVNKLNFQAWVAGKTKVWWFGNMNSSGKSILSPSPRNIYLMPLRIKDHRYPMGRERSFIFQINKTKLNNKMKIFSLIYLQRKKCEIEIINCTEHEIPMVILILANLSRIYM